MNCNESAENILTKILSSEDFFKDGLHRSHALLGILQGSDSIEFAFWDPLDKTKRGEELLDLFFFRELSSGSSAKATIPSPYRTAIFGIMRKTQCERTGLGMELAEEKR